MGIFKKIKEIIFKIKDYDRLENDYCTVLDMATGARLSKPNYTMEAVQEAFNEFLDEHDKIVYHPAAQVENILNTIGKDATWMVVSLHTNGRDTHFFRYGYKIRKNELSEDEKFGFTSWVHCVYNNMQSGHSF